MASVCGAEHSGVPLFKLVLAEPDGVFVRSRPGGQSDAVERAVRGVEEAVVHQRTEPFRPASGCETRISISIPQRPHRGLGLRKRGRQESLRPSSRREQQADRAGAAASCLVVGARLES